MTPSPSQNRTSTVLGIALALFLGALDQTIVSAALPRIVGDLGGLDRYTWVTTVYLLVSTLLVPLYGKLSDIVNRRSLELFSVGIFLLGSLLCGAAGEWGTLPVLGDGMTQLIVFRGLQGVGGAGIFALAFILLSDLFPPRERGKVGGIFGAIFGLASILGPLLGGFLADQASGWLASVAGWRWVFYVNLPLGLVALWFLATRMPNLRPSDPSRALDLTSVALLVLAFFPLILGLQIDKGQHPWTSLEVVGLLALAAVGIVVWIVHSLKFSPHPILDLKLFRNPVFTWGLVAVFFFGAAFLTVLIFLPLYMVEVQGVSATQAGASVIPLTLGVVLGAGIGGPLATRWGRYKSILTTGAAITLLGGLLITLLTLGSPLWLILTAMVITGIGLGPAQSLYALAVQNAVDPRELGQATSLIQFSRQIGSTVGAALAGALFSAAAATSFAALGTGHDRPLSSAQFRQGPQEIRAEFAQTFDKLVDRTEDLFDLRGEEAAAALKSFLADPDVPVQLKDKLQKGTPAMRMEEIFRKLEADLEVIVLAGDRVALQKLFASKEGEGLPDASRKGIEDIVGQGRADRVASIPKLRAQMESGMGHAIEGASLVAKAVVKAQLETAGEDAANTVVGKLSRAFSEALRPVWGLTVVLLALLVVATGLLPGRPLHGRNGEPSQKPGD